MIEIVLGPNNDQIMMIPKMYQDQIMMIENVLGPNNDDSNLNVEKIHREA